MKKFFMDSGTGRLRAGWRILLFIVLLIGLSTAGQILLKTAVGGVPDTTGFMKQAILICIIATAATLAVFIARRLLDRKTFVSLGLGVDRHTLGDFVFGFLLSGLMGGAFLLAAMHFGDVKIDAVHWSWSFVNFESFDAFANGLLLMGAGTLLVVFFHYLTVAWWEEIVFRGYILQNLMDGLGAVVAVLISCLIYGAIHAFNPNATMLSSAIIVLFGFLRIYGYLATNMLWLSFGMHTGWNFFQGPVYGFAASGTDSPHLLGLTISGPEWRSGGDFGPEGSVVILPILAAAIALMWLWVRVTRSSEK